MASRPQLQPVDVEQPALAVVLALLIAVQAEVTQNDASPAMLGAQRDHNDTNLTALFGLTQLVGRHVLARRNGVIVNMASPSAAVSLDRYGLAGYGATKAGVVALTRELAYQWAGAECG